MAVEVGTAYVPVIPEMTGFQSQVGAGVRRSSAGIASGLRTFGRAMGITLGIAMAVEIGKASVNAFESIEKSSQRLEFGLKKVGMSGAAALSPVLDWAKNFSVQAGVMQGDIVDVASKLTTMGSAFFKAVGPDAAKWIEQITQGLIDMSAGTGKSVSMLMRSLGPAILNTPEKAVTLLQKYGVLTDAQVLKIKKLTDAGKAQAATQMEITAIQEKYAGASAKTATAEDKLKVVWNNLEIVIGRFIGKALPFLVWATGATQAAQKFRIALLAVTAVIIGLISWPVLLGIAITALAVVVIQNWNKVKRVTQTAWNAIEHAVGKAIGTIIGWMADLLTVVLGAFSGIIHGAATAFGWIPGIGGKLKAADRAFQSWKDGIINGLRATSEHFQTFGSQAARATAKANEQMKQLNATLLQVAAHSRIHVVIDQTGALHGGIAAQHGFHGWVQGDTLIHAGEHGTRERVDVTPAAQMGAAGATYNLTVNGERIAPTSEDLGRILRRARSLSGV